VTTLRNLFYVLVGAVLAIFIYFNFDQRVVIYFMGWRTREAPLALALFGALLLGFLVAAVLGVADQLRLRSRLRVLRRNVERLEAELGELRRHSLEDSLPSPPASGSSRNRNTGIATESDSDSNPGGL
jgi:uncharacterized integral membrane protein